MDPGTAAGVGIAVVSLSFQLFAGCIKGFTLLSTAHHLGKDSNTLLCLLNLQEARLTDWARLAGLLEDGGKLDRRLNEVAANETLGELESLLSVDTGKLKNRYGLSLVAKSSSTEGKSEDTLDPSLSRGIMSQIVSDETRRDIMFRAELIQSKNHLPKRLWWAAVEKNKFDELIRRIRDLVDGLVHLLDSLRQEDLSKKSERILTQLIGMEDRLDNLFGLQKMLASVMVQQDAISLATAAGIKALRINIGDNEAALPRRDDEVAPSDTTNANEQPIKSRRDYLQELEPLNPMLLTAFQSMETRADMGLACYDGVPVFVEWKDVPPHIRSKSIQRAGNLTILLNAPKGASFRSLHCKGLIQDNDRGKLAFIYDHPCPNNPRQPQSLRSLLSEKAPSVTARLELALQIARTIKLFHTAEWLHKNIRSENVLFFSPAKASRPATTMSKDLIAHPLLAGFSFARFNSPTEPSEQPSLDPQQDLYRHPDALGEPSIRFSKSKDNYALGTVLLEIAEWRSLRSIVANKVVDFSQKDVPLEQIAKVKPFLLDEAGSGTEKLTARMADIYGRVTRMCLSGTIDNGEGVEHAEQEVTLFGPDLLDTAVQELEKCVI